MLTENPSPRTGRRLLRRASLAMGAGLVALTLLLAAFCLEENSRGSRAWAACQRELQARGEILDWQAFIPPPAPDEQNLAMAALFVRELHYQADPKTGAYTFGQNYNSPGKLEEMPFAGPRPDYIRSSGSEMARHTDLAGYARYYRQKDGFPHADHPQSPEADVLLALSRYDETLNALSQAAATRPLTRFPVDWHRDDVSNIRLSHYILQQRLVSTLRVRAAARLAAGREEGAFDDLALCLRLSRDMGDEHLLIGALEQYTCLRMILCSLWDGLADRHWSAASLARFQEDLQRFDPIRNYSTTIRHERTFAIQAATFLQKRGDAWLLFDPPSILQAPPSMMLKKFVLSVDGLTPPGWYDLNKVVISYWIQDYLLGSVDPAAHRIHPDKLAIGKSAMESLPKRPANVFAKFMVGALEATARHLARAQTTLNQAIIACALERFFLNHQAYPASLAELAPVYLSEVPKDIIDGAPLRYRLMPDGRFQLYSIGWNSRDDGGRVAWNSSNKLKDEEGDWVWQYAELSPPPPSATKN